MASSSATSWHVRAVSLPDGDEPEDLWIVDGRLTGQPVAGARELPGGWVLPGGLVDAHVHLTMNFGKVMPHADGSDALMAANGAAQRHAGVLALRDTGCAWGGVPRESPDGPRLQRAGSLMAPAGRGYPNVCRAVAPEDLVRAALEEVAAGAQWVKVLGDFPGDDGNWFAAPSNYSSSVLGTLVREVHAAGARVMGHSTGLGAADLVAAGVDSVEHGMALTPDRVARMADRGIAWTSTLATAFKHVGALAEQASPVGAYIRAQFDRLRELFPRAVALGVPVLAGTDEIPMGALARELSLLVSLGLTPAQAIAAGSTRARAWLGFPEPIVGGSADLATFDADPRLDLDVLARPAAVVFDGVRVR
ncbi:MAG: amidohydrolase family protein [Acidobacteriota bacterium]|nr:amidohydrolase family protein [Acidobacteriota bacterium]